MNFLSRIGAALLVLGSLTATTIIPIAVSAQESNPVTPGAPQPRLYCGTDASGFAGVNGQLAVVETSGSHVVSVVKLFGLDFPLNGVTSAFGKLITGQPDAVGNAGGNTLRFVSETSGPPTLISTILPGRNSFSASCCNEQMVVAPDGSVYHAHYSTAIQQIALDSAGKSEVLRTFAQPNVVGMATDGTQIWISNWDEREVGTWDPNTNAFTPIFLTPDNAGALAWDVANGVLWVGMQGGSVIPYNEVGQQLGVGFQPFGSIAGDTVDGLAFVPQ